MTEKRVLGIAAFTLLMVSVGWAQKVTVEFDQNADFSRYKTFAIRGGQLNTTNPALNSELVRKQIEGDIERALEAKGLSPTLGKADLGVRYRLGASRKKEVERYPAGWRGLRTRTVRTGYAEGTLTINLRDAAAKSLVWRGIATEDKSSADQIAGKLDDMVRKCLDRYPPKK